MISPVSNVAKDISLPSPQRRAVVEVNAAPGILMHLYPSQGSPQRGKRLVDFLFPRNRRPASPFYRSPAPTAKQRWAADPALLMQSEKRSGRTRNDGIYVNRRRIFEGDHAAPKRPVSAVQPGH
jgi:cyanophycin synthetase